MTDQLLLRMADLPAPGAWLFSSRSTASSSTAKQARLRPSAALSTAREQRLDWIVPITPGETTSELVERSRRVHEAIKARLRARNPSLQRHLSHDEIVRLMDGLSQRVAEETPFATWQEAEAFMKGEDYHDLGGH